MYKRQNDDDDDDDDDDYVARCIITGPVSRALWLIFSHTVPTASRDLASRISSPSYDTFYDVVSSRV